MTLVGNADERGSREYNMGLGERRGNAVSSALQANGGSASQMNVVSYGE
jgi:peptidoglycan-associated lipoprotein